jgi:hypothetical protein
MSALLHTAQACCLLGAVMQQTNAAALAALTSAQHVAL